jgi:hypothetical protein
MSAVLDSPWRRLRYTRLIDLLRGRLDGSLDWRRAIDSSALTAELAQIVHDVVRLTRLWRRERAAVATELAAHFRDGLDAGQTPAELAASFGDCAAAAKLIRRAKRRGRSLWWHAGRWCFWGVTAVWATYMFLWARMWWDRPDVRVDYLVELNRRASGVDPAEAAWPVYLRVVREMGGRDNRLPPEVDWEALPDAATTPQFAAFATQNRETIAQLREATRRRELGAELQSDGDFQTQLLWDRVWMRTLDVSRQLLLLLQSDARLAEWQGDIDRAVEDAIAMVNLGRQLEEQSFLSMGRYQASCTKEAFEFIKDLMRDHQDDITDEQLRDLAHAVANVKLNWAWWIEGEKSFALDFIQHLYTDDGAGDGRITVEGLEIMRGLVPSLGREVGNHGWMSAPRPYDASWWQQFSAFDAKVFAAPVAMASRREVTDVLDRFYDEASKLGDQPLWEWHSTEAEKIVSTWSQSQQLTYYPLTLVLPRFGDARREAEWRRGAQDGVLVGVALEMYRREHGSWPERLTELSPQYLPRVPVDRMNGKPLGYVVRDDWPIVYSVGADLDDDGGLAVAPNHEWLVSPEGYGVSTPHNNDGDWVLWGGALRRAGD